MKVLSWINFILGVWLLVAGFAISATVSAVMTEEIALGIIIAVLALATIRTGSRAVAWWTAVAGLWTLLAPAAINYGSLAASKANDVVVGIVVLVLAVIAAVYRGAPMRTPA